jgi:hypothetical protein
MEGPVLLRLFDPQRRKLRRACGVHDAARVPLHRWGAPRLVRALAPVGLPLQLVRALGCASINSQKQTRLAVVLLARRTTASNHGLLTLRLSSTGSAERERAQHDGPSLHPLLRRHP